MVLKIRIALKPPDEFSKVCIGRIRTTGGGGGPGVDRNQLGTRGSIMACINEGEPVSDSTKYAEVASVDRKGEIKACLTNSLKALESTLKTILHD